MNQLMHYVRLEPKRVSAVVVLQIICSVFRVANALVNVFILNSLIKLDFKMFFIYVALEITLFTVMSFFLVLKVIAKTRAVQYMSLRLKQDILKQIESQPIAKYKEHDTGVYASWLTNDMTMIEQNGFNNMMDLIQIITDPLLSIIALIQFNWSFLPLVILMSFFTIFLPQIVRKKLSKSNLSMTKENEKVVNVINDGLRGFSTFQIFGVQHQLEERITRATLQLIHRKMYQSKYQGVANNIAGLSNMIGQISIQAWTGYLALQKIVSIGVISSSTNLAFNVFNSLAVVAPTITDLRALNPVLKKYHLNEKPNNNGTKMLPDTPFDLRAHELQFFYKPGQTVFKQPLTFEIKHGQKFAVYGDSGSGKSTLLRILSGQLRDYRGQLKLNGVEMDDLSYNEIRKKAIYVDQSPYLFNDTIRYNLELGKNFSDKDIKSALQKADLYDFVNNLSDKLDTNVGEGGASLSGGQKQRLALARGLLRKQQFFLLDESTSNLDKASALKVEDSFLNQSDATVIFVSHQLHEENADRFDKIIEV